MKSDLNHKLKLALDKLVEAMAIIGFTGLVVIAFMTLVDVLFRYLGLPRFVGLNDIEEVGFAIVIASCFPAGLRAGNAVTVRVLGKLLGPKWHTRLDCFGGLLTLLFFCVVAWQFLVFTSYYFQLSRTTSTLELSVWPVWSLVCLIMITCVVVQLRIFIISVIDVKKGNLIAKNNNSQQDYNIL